MLIFFIQRADQPNIRLSGVVIPMKENCGGLGEKLKKETTRTYIVTLNGQLCKQVRQGGS